MLCGIGAHRTDVVEKARVYTITPTLDYNTQAAMIICVFNTHKIVDVSKHIPKVCRYFGIVHG